MSSSVRKVVVVTGAARGIGLAVVRKFLAEGWRIALIDIDEPNLLRTCAQLKPERANDDNVLALPCDVAVPAQVNAAIAASVEHYGRIDALVNNAGVAVFKPLLQTSYEEWSRV
ncbi:MAG: NAD(P)-dependent dehydrogenase (short-subunit alcohol dehydrogenase family), partial [Gammaproteobacteria bacterium]